MESEYAYYLLDKTRRDYNKIYKQFSNTRNFLWPEMKKFADLVRDNSQVLDLGCGNGRIYAASKSKNIKYLGIDFSEGLIKEAREHF